MKGFADIHFNGVFRDYQQNVLNHLEQHLQNRKIHIVAAPGSGKTVLGLELIRKLNAPALIFSPTITIRQQWGERFGEKFMPAGGNLGDCFSYDLKNPKLLTSTTYQALHAAFNRLAELADGEPDAEDGGADGQAQDFTDFDLLEAVRKAGIRTVCLDEAHHLRSEWQKSLESFVEALGSQVVIVALTATPPYDSTPAEWDRYISLCGDIDDEISVPQLVAQGTLCPHQDYIYFNYPTQTEIKAMKERKEKAYSCVQEILEGPLFEEILANSAMLTQYPENSETILENAKGFIAILCLTKAAGREIPPKLVKLLLPSGALPKPSLQFAETAFEFVIASPEIFMEETSDKLKHFLSQQGLIERKRVRLESCESLNRSLVSSLGKLDSITKIVEAEARALGPSMRMLILTDYIKKDLIRLIGTDEPIDAMGTAPVFEAVRRSLHANLNIAVLSGSLVILPDALMEPMKAIAASKGAAYFAKPIGTTRYSEISFGGSNREKVEIITEAFQCGHIHILIGTKSLLGEGWDSPCINSLILASFVGTFMLSNQMRGRAIRIDPGIPGKVANIWHLVTVEPPNMLYGVNFQGWLLPNLDFIDKIPGEDYETLKRRFGCFLAPSYDGKSIESGIGRIGILRPPFNEQGIAEIDRTMLELSADRASVAQMWKGAVNGSLHPEIVDQNEIPENAHPKRFLFFNALNEFLLSVFLAVSVRTMIITARASGSGPLVIVCLALSLVICCVMGLGFVRILKHLSPRKDIETLGLCILNSLREIGEIKSPAAVVDVQADPLDTYIRCSLCNATSYEKSVFFKALSELLSSIDNPRYLLIKRNWLLFFTWQDCIHSYACPSVFSARKETVEVFTRNLTKTTGSFEMRYTRSEEGRRLLLKCRRLSYINRNEIYVKGKKVAISKWE